MRKASGGKKKTGTKRRSKPPVSRAARSAPARTPRNGSAADGGSPAPDLPPGQVGHMRELFWQNVMREILTSLSTVSAMRPGSTPQSTALVENTPPAGAHEETDAPPPEQIVAHSGTEMEPHHESYQPELFDGRLAVILKNGERVPIADVFPVFACGISAPAARALSVAVECSVFQIRTPQGQVYTLPLHEMRGFHALTPELIKRIAQASRAKRRRPEAPESMPFGFAAFTSMARGQDVMVPEAPDHPTE